MATAKELLSRVTVIEENKQVSKNDVFKPGDVVPASGIYVVEHDVNNPHHEVTCIQGKIFPPSNKVKHPRYRIVHQAIHIENHEDHKP
ncbi:hypothetical protein ACO0LL_02320 [Undibacterium sp. TC4M20W]|uniref:hypothetical protein n=1 Tax=Undibacterium sp. TC4M20W TaxID=3413052 RepID=UPI003BF2842D